MSDSRGVGYASGRAAVVENFLDFAIRDSRVDGERSCGFDCELLLTLYSLIDAMPATSPVFELVRPTLRCFDGRGSAGSPDATSSSSRFRSTSGPIATLTRICSV